MLNTSWRKAQMALLSCLCLPGACSKEERAKTGSVAQTPPQKQIFVGTPVEPKDWPYRYTLVKEGGTWSGEVEYAPGSEGIALDTIGVISSDDHRIAFAAMYGGPGKVLPSTWDLSLTKTATGFEGNLMATGGATGIPRVRLEFVSRPEWKMPSSKLPEQIRTMDDHGYRTAEALRYEVTVARREWELESKVAARIAELRSDDSLRKGVRREWTGPAWVRDVVNPEEAKYFERICCVYLGGTKVTDADVIAISSLTELRELFLHSTGITDAGLTQINKLRRLRILHLPETSVSDAGLIHLAALSGVERIYLARTKVTGDGGSRLKAQLPNAKIEW